MSLFCQNKSLLDYDVCKDETDKALQKKYLKAVNYYNNKKFKDASLLLQEIIHKDENFASPYFLMGMIGVVTDNTKMIVKYFPLVKEICPEFNHPYLYYYMGMIDYTYEKYEKASKDFEQFLTLTDGNNYYDSLQNLAINYIDWSDFLNRIMGNKVPFEPKKISFLAKNKNYYEPFITCDKQQIYFIREEITRDTNKDSFIENISTHINRFSERSLLDSTGFYDKGFILDAPFNLAKKESGVSITADNRYMFFSRKMEEDDNNSWDIFYCENIDGYWSNAKSTGFNTKAWDEFSPSVSADGNTMYFVSNREGGKGGYDIWYVKKTSNDSWSEPMNMGRNVNTFLDETYPFIAADNLHLYFLSNGRKTIGGFDIFCYNTAEDKPAQNIGYPINTEDNEHAIGVMLDGKTAYTTKKNDDNKFNEIITFTLPDNVISEKRIIKKAKLSCEIELEANILLQNLRTNELQSYFVSSSNKDLSFILEEKTSYLVTFYRQGFMFFAQIINSLDDSIEIALKPLESGQDMSLNSIEFNKEGSGFSDLSNVVLDSFVEFLKLNRAQRIILKSNNKTVNAVNDYLVKSGIRQDRIDKQINNSNTIIYQIK